MREDKNESGQLINEDTVRQLFKGSSTNFLGVIFSLLFAFFSKTVAARYLSVGDFGSISLAFSITSVLAAVCIIGLDSAITRHIPRCDTSSEKRDIIYSGLIIGIAVPLFVSIVLIIATPLLTERLLEGSNMRLVFPIFAFMVPLFAFVKLTVAVIRGYELTFPKIAIENIMMPVSRFLLVAGATLAGIGILGIASAYLLSFLAAGALSAYYLYQHADLSVGTSFSPRISEMVYFALPLALSGPISMLFTDFDVILLGALKSSQAVGPYEIAYTLGNIFTVFVGSIGFILLPMMSRFHSTQEIDQMQQLYFISNKWIIAATLPPLLVSIWYPEQIILMTFGGKYTSGTAAFVILAIAFTVHASLGPNGGFLTAIGATQRALYANAITGAFNIILNFALIPQYGGFGAAIATGTSYMLLNIIYSAVLYFEVGLVPWSLSFVRTVVSAILLFISMIVPFSRVFDPTSSNVLLFSVVYATLFLILQVNLGFVEEPEQMILDGISDRFGLPVTSFLNLLEYNGRKK